MDEPSELTVCSIAVVGGGLAGSLLAICLAERGHRVDVWERRGDPRAGTGPGDRSINLGLSARGIAALRRVGLWDALAPRVVPMSGRIVHRAGRAHRFHPYGRNPAEILYSVRRDELTAMLVDRAEKCAGVRFRFRSACVAVDRDTATLTLADETGARTTHRYDVVVGADGASSTVRAALLRGAPVSYAQDFLDWGYKELTIPANPDGSARTPIEALHVWPGDGALVVAHPNVDRSLTCTLLLPWHSTGRWTGFDRLATAAAATGYVRTRFPDLLDLIPDFAAQFDAHPAGHLVTVRVGRWHHADRVVLAGDACHAVTPFYGQGMNAAFEDCVVLADCLARHPRDRAAAFADYQRRRKPHTDVLAELSIRNFRELRDRLRSPWHVTKARADLLLNRLFPTAWQPLYTMVAHTELPYGEAVRRARRQDRVLAGAGAVVLGAGVAAGRHVARRLRRADR